MYVGAAGAGDQCIENLPRGGIVNLVCSILCTLNTDFGGGGGGGGSGGSFPQKILNLRCSEIASSAI